MRPLITLMGSTIVAFVLCPCSAQRAESPDAEPAWKQVDRTGVPTLYNQAPVGWGLAPRFFV